MAEDPQHLPETEIELHGAYHRYYGADHYGDQPGGPRRIPEELWRVLRAWDRSSWQADTARRHLPVAPFLAAAAAGIMAALLYKGLG